MGKKKIVKKKTNKFTRFQAHRFKRTIPQPKIGYGSNKKTAHRLKNGFYKFLVTCPGDLEMLTMHNGKYAAELAHNLSAKTRRAVVARADQLNVCVVNRNARQ